MLWAFDVCAFFFSSAPCVGQLTAGIPVMCLRTFAFFLLPRVDMCMCHSFSWYRVVAISEDVIFLQPSLLVDGMLGDSWEYQVPEVPEISGSLPDVSGDVSAPSVGGSGVDVGVAMPSVGLDASAPSASSVDLPGECIAWGVVFLLALYCLPLLPWKYQLRLMFVSVSKQWLHFRT